MEHIYIFDYNTGSIYHGKLLPDENPEDFLTKNGLCHSDCTIMITDSEKEIEELEELD